MVLIYNHKITDRNCKTDASCKHSEVISSTEMLRSPRKESIGKRKKDLRKRGRDHQKRKPKVRLKKKEVKSNG